MIRQFLTGNASTLVLDLVFSVVFIAVMLAHSGPQTLVVVSLPLYLGLSLAITPLRLALGLPCGLFGFCPRFGGGVVEPLHLRLSCPVEHPAAHPVPEVGAISGAGFFNGAAALDLLAGVQAGRVNLHAMGAGKLNEAHAALR